METNKNTLDFIERCENRLSLLNNKLQDTYKSLQDVQEASTKIKTTLMQQASQLKETICKIVDQNMENLHENVDITKQRDEEYLKDLDENLLKDIEKLKHMMEEAQSLRCTNPTVLETMNQALTDLGRGVPELPVVSLSFSTKFDELALSQINEKIKDVLQLSMTGAVQVVECLERPGSIIIKWDEQQSCDSESVTTDASVFTEYILQASKGKPSDEEPMLFNTIYEGEDMQYTMNFAEPNEFYSFRVCHYYTNSSGVGVVGAWSMTKQAVTTLTPHVWRCEDCVTESGLQLYQLSNKARTATKVFPESSRILRSKSSSYTLGQTLTFWIEETGESSIKDGIGFIALDQQAYKQLTLLPNAAVLNTQGAIFVNGLQMVTKLPALKKNSIIIFHVSKEKSGKLRVTISIDNKEVTFDWTVSSTNEINDKLFFASGFEHTGWQVSVG